MGDLQSSPAPFDPQPRSFHCKKRKTSAHSIQWSSSFEWVPNPGTNDYRVWGWGSVVHSDGSKCGPHHVVYSEHRCSAVYSISFFLFKLYNWIRNIRKSFHPNICFVSVWTSLTSGQVIMQWGTPQACLTARWPHWHLSLFVDSWWPSSLQLQTWNSLANICVCLFASLHRSVCQHHACIEIDLGGKKVKTTYRTKILCNLVQRLFPLLMDYLHHCKTEIRKAGIKIFTEAMLPVKLVLVIPENQQLVWYN